MSERLVDPIDKNRLPVPAFYRGGGGEAFFWAESTPAGTITRKPQEFWEPKDCYYFRKLLQTTPRSCFSHAVAFYLAYDPERKVVDLPFYRRLVLSAEKCRRENTAQIDQGGGVLPFMNVLFDLENGESGALVSQDSGLPEGVEYGVIGVKFLPRPSYIPSYAQSLVDKTLTTGVIKEHKGCWYWPRGHAITVYQAYECPRKGPETMMLGIYDPMLGRMMAMSTTELGEYMYPRGAAVTVDYYDPLLYRIYLAHLRRSD